MPFALRASRSASMARVSACEWPGKKSAKTKKEAKERVKSRPDLQSAAQRKKAKKLTVDDVFDLMEAGGQHRVLVGPGGALAFELGQESGSSLLLLVLRLLKQLLLLRQLRSQ